MKKLLAFVITLAMLASMMVLPAWATTVETTDMTELCPCGCGKALSQVEWVAWDVNNNGKPDSGHYYLDSDYAQDDQYTISEGFRVVLDLRGNTLSCEGLHRFFLLYGYMAVIDSVGGGRLLGNPTGDGNGGILMLATGGSVFELFAGTIMPAAGANPGKDGGIAVVAAGATFRMHGGILMNGSSSTHGGAINGRAGSFIEILGGQILDCKAASSGGSIYSTGTVTVKNATVLGGDAGGYGGNFFQSGGSLTIENSYVAHGMARKDSGTQNGGGNVCAYGGETSFTDSTFHNGYAYFNGGNLYLGSGTHVLKGVTATAGVAGLRGGNLASSNSSAKITLEDCSFPGELSMSSGSLTLKGKVTIGLLNNGLNLVRSDGTTLVVADASGLTAGSEIYVNAAGRFAAAGAKLDYFKGALRTVLSESAEGLVGTQATSGTLSGYCPHCGQQVVWNAFSTTDSMIAQCFLDAEGDTDPACTGRHLESGHYYLTQDYTGFSQHYIGIRLGEERVPKDVVIDLAGFDLTASRRPFYLNPGKDAATDSRFTLLDSQGGSVVTGSGADGQSAGVIYNEGSHLTIYGGKYVYKPVDGRTITGGGVILAGDSFTMHGGILDGSAFNNPEGKGGAIQSFNADKGADKYVTITAGLILGGTANAGGAIHVGLYNHLSITGGLITGGNAVNNAAGEGGQGGNIRTYATSSSNDDGTLVVKDCALTNGTAERCAGNLDIQYCTATVENAYFANGSASSYAGNLNCAGSAPIALTDCVFLDGAAPKGGNIYVPTTNTDLEVKDCRLYNGQATSTAGGNFYAGNGRITILGCELAFGTAKTLGGNVYAMAGNAASSNFLRLGASDKGQTQLICGAAVNGGNLAVKSVCYLDAVRMHHGNATLGSDLYLDSKGENQLLSIGSNVTGTIGLGVNPKNLGTPAYGNTIANTACQSLNAEIVLEGDYGMPGVCGMDGALYVASLGLKTQEGQVTWYQDEAKAMADMGENDILQLYADRALTLTKDIFLDVNGFKAQVSGAYTVYGMDSTGDDFAVPTGSLQAAAETTISTDHTAPNGNRYLTLTENGVSTFHRLQLQLTDMVLRPSSAGIYYNGTWGCDEQLRANMDSYGMAVSVKAIPGADFATDDHSLWTKLDAAAMESGKKQAGAIIEGILKTDRTDAQNESYAQMQIYATAYLRLKDGTVMLSDAYGTSLYDLVKTLDGLLETQPKTYGINTAPARAFYETWKSVMGAWELTKIPTPVDDGVIDVLMIGNSFCHYYVQELYAVAEAAGVKMRVCNLYYGGCPLEKHYTWWLEDSTPYTYYNTDGNGRVGTSNVSLEWALSQHEWDVLSIQEVSSTLRNRSAADAFEMNLLYMDTLIPYLMGRFPDADFYWHQTWAYEKGFSVSSYKVLDAAEQKAYAQRQREYALAVCERYDIPRVPSGVAWELVRDGGYDQLCARLGKADGDNPHAGDYYHDGDIGGGQLLNAYVWFEMITGLSCEGNTYVPTYTYSGTTYGLLDGITIQQLQAAAHQAVAEYRAEQQ